MTTQDKERLLQNVKEQDNKIKSGSELKSGQDVFLSNDNLEEETLTEEVIRKSRLFPTEKKSVWWWMGFALLFFSGLFAPYFLIKSMIQNARNFFKMIKYGLKYNPEIPHFDDANANIRYKKYCKAYKLNKEAQEKMKNVALFSSNVNFSLAGICLLFIGFYEIPNNFMLLSKITSVLVSSLLIIKGLISRSHYENFRDKEQISFVPWLLAKIKKISGPGLAVAFCGLMISGSQAFADVSSFSSDISSGSIWTIRNDTAGKIFGFLLNTSSDAPLSAYFHWFNATVLFFVCGWTIYQIIHSIIDTAHDGEMFGKAYHSAYTPLKTAISTSFVAPVTNAGLSLMQAGILMLAVGFCNIASDLWQGFVQGAMEPRIQTDSALKSGSAQMAGMSNLPNNAGGLDLVNGVMRSELCFQAYYQQAKLDNSNIQNFLSEYNVKEPDSKGQLITDSNGNSINVWDYGSCGSFSVNMAANFSKMQSSYYDVSGLPGASNGEEYSSDINSSNSSGAYSSDMSAIQSFIKTRKNNIEKVINSVRSIQSELITSAQNKIIGYHGNDGFGIDFYSHAKPVADLYNSNQIKNSLTVTQALNGSVYKAIDDSADDWALGGAYARAMSVKQQQIINIASQGASIEQPTTVTPKAEMGTIHRYLDAVNPWASSDSQEQATLILRAFDKEWKKEIAAQNPSAINSALIGSVNDSTGNGISQLTGPWFRSFAQYLLTPQEMSADPIGDQVAYGNNILYGAQALYMMGGISALATGNEVGIVSGIKSLFDYVNISLWGIMLPVLILGFTDSYVLPNMMNIAVSLVFSSYVVSLIFYIMACPLATMLFGNLKGGELIGQQQSVVIKLAFSVCIRPILIVGFMGLSFYINIILLNFINYSFGSAYSANMTNDFDLIGIIGLIVGIAMHVLMDSTETAFANSTMILGTSAVANIINVDAGDYGMNGKHTEILGGMANNIRHIADRSHKGMSPISDKSDKGKGDSDNGISRPKSGGPDDSGPKSGGPGEGKNPDSDVKKPDDGNEEDKGQSKS